jgi:transposase
MALSHAEELQFVPAVLDMTPSPPSVRRQRKTPRRQVEPGAGMIEVEIDGGRFGLAAVRTQRP